MTRINLLYMVHIIEYSVFMYVSLRNLLISGEHYSLLSHEGATIIWEDGAVVPNYTIITRFIVDIIDRFHCVLSFLPLYYYFPIGYRENIILYGLNSEHVSFVVSWLIIVIVCNSIVTTFSGLECEADQWHFSWRQLLN